ncbi:ATP-binding protein, partial [Candidatus Bathyarchaeota archaeon]|nr:ATP-binding protein [Candidatus Bathyarchaeota archaeon]
MSIIARNLSGFSFVFKIDPELMLRVFINLVTNAIQAMPNGGQLTVSAAKTEEHNLLSVEDTGIGI